MSSRAFRRLQNDSSFAIQLPSVAGEREEGEEEDSRPALAQSKKKNINPFDMLMEEDISSQEEEREEREENVTITASNNMPSGHRQQSSKKKKKKKKKDKQAITTPAPSTNDDDIDTALREVSDMLGGLETSSSMQKEEHKIHSSQIRPLLCVDRRYLNADNEMRRIFGSRVVRSEQNQRRTHRRRYQKQTILATPKDTWPPMEKLGLGMILDENRNNCQYFKFTHSLEYQKVQFSFWDAVDSYDPNTIAAVLHTHPYHIDSLIQLSEVCKMGEDLQMAADLIERALYSFESTFHPLFNYTQDNCRLDYTVAENRSIFLVIFHHINYIGRRGCHRTAFEFCKLLLSLDPDTDPLGVLLMIDYYALRCDQYQFLIDMDQLWETKKNLSQLPNCAFSIPLALFHLSSRLSEESEGGKLLHEANLKLQSALFMFPSLLVPLLDKCSVQLDRSASNHTYFTSPKKDPDALKLLITLYIERTCSLWKLPEVLSWLETNVKIVVERVQKEDELVQKCTQMRQRCYEGTPRNIYRHVVMSDMESVRTELPQDITRNPIIMYDPLPPDNSTRDYKRPERSVNPLENDDSNPFALFLRSLLPSFNMQAPIPHRRAAGIPQPGGEEEEEEEGGAVARVDHLEAAIVHLTGTVQALLEGIRTAVNIAPEEQNDEEREEEDDELD